MTHSTSSRQTPFACRLLCSPGWQGPCSALGLAGHRGRKGGTELGLFITSLSVRSAGGCGAVCGGPGFPVMEEDSFVLCSGSYCLIKNGLLALRAPPCTQPRHSRSSVWVLHPCLAGVQTHFGGGTLEAGGLVRASAVSQDQVILLHDCGLRAAPCLSPSFSSASL